MLRFSGDLLTMERVKKMIAKSVFVLCSLLAFAALNADAQTEQKPKPLPKQISGGILNGKAVSLPKPEYPAAAWAEKASGKVGVQVLIDEGGNVISATATSGPENAALRSAAEAAAMNAKFSPTLLSGNPVKVSGVIMYNFVFKENHEEAMNAFGATMVLFVIKDIASDSEKFRHALAMDNGELRSVLKEAATDPDFSGLEPLATLDATPAAKRAEVIESALAAMRSKLDAEGQWKFELGRSFADAVGGLMLQAVDPNPDASKIDEIRIKKGLKEMKVLLANAPKGIPKIVLEKLNDLAALADREDLLTEVGFPIFSARVEAVISTISPD